MKSRPASAALLLLHDGELADVRDLLEELAVPYVERRGEVSCADREARWDVVVAAAPLGHKFPSVPGIQTTRIAVLEAESRTLRAMLRRAGFDYVIRRPVHPTALRLVLVHALYRGPEKRRKQRVTVGGRVRFRIGLRRHTAVLADLSLTGCRLLSPVEPAVGQRLRVRIPQDLTGRRPVPVSGRVVRVDASRDGGEAAVAVTFEGLSARAAQQVAELVKTHSSGPAVAAGERADAPAAAREEPPVAPTEEAPPDRRSATRHEMPRHVIALGETSARVLMGRDVSLGGMRVEPHESLAIGDRLQLALHVRAREEPLVVAAEVTRDDGERGLVLQFTDLNEESRKYLERMVHLLPVLAVREADDAEAGVIVSEILEHGPVASEG